MKTPQSNQTEQQPSENDVLRRMLSTPPKQHEKPKPAKKTASKKISQSRTK